MTNSIIVLVLCTTDEKQCADASARQADQQSVAARHQISTMLETARRREDAQAALTSQLTDVVESLRAAAASANNGRGGSNSEGELDANVQAQFGRYVRVCAVIVDQVAKLFVCH